MPTAVVLTVSTPQPAGVPVAVARGLHAWLLARIPRAMADRLHRPNQQRPFTVSNLHGGGPRRDGRVTLSPDHCAYLRLTALTGEMEQALIAALPAPGATLALADATVQVQALAAHPGQHPWAASASYADLVQHYTLAAGPDPATLTLRFASPTLFRVEGRDEPLPQPGLILGSLWRKWNAFAPRPLPEEVLDYGRRWVSLGRFSLRSSLVDHQNAGKGAQAGFVGTVTLRLRQEDAYCQRALRLLCAYSYWCGVGYGASRGLGQCRLVNAGKV